MSLSKKIFITSSVLLAVVLIFWGIYNLSFSNGNDKKSTSDTNTNSTAKPAVDEKNSSAKITRISDEAMLAPFIDLASSTIKYYLKNTGQVHQIDFDGKNKKTISDAILNNLADILWSPSGTKVIARWAKEGIDKFSYFNYDTKINTPIRDNVDSFVWQGDNKVFYKFYNPATQERFLSIANPDISDWANIASFAYPNVSIAPIPRTGLISFWNRPDAFFETNFASVPIPGGATSSIFKGKFGADFLWNNSGTYALASHSDQKSGSQIQLATINSKGGEYKNLDIATFVSKCAWSKDNKTIYYALPDAMPANMILPNDYIDKKFNTQDSFWKFNTITGEKSKILGADKTPGDVDAENLFFNADESMLFFINRLDDKLYRIDL